jgi:hypothetical protein
LAFMSQGIYACINTCKICIGMSQRTMLFGKAVCVCVCVCGRRIIRQMNRDEMWRNVRKRSEFVGLESGHCAGC